MTEADLNTETRQKKIDNLLNKMLLDITVFSAIGWTVGLGAGLLFHRKAPIRNILAGVGGGYGFVSNRVSLKRYVWPWCRYLIILQCLQTLTWKISTPHRFYLELFAYGFAPPSANFPHHLSHNIESFADFSIFFELIRVQVQNLFIFALRTRIEQQIFISIDHDLAFIVEVDLDQFVVESEQDSLIRFDPFFYINEGQRLLLGGHHLSPSTLEVLPKVLHQGQLLRELFIIWATRYSKRHQPVFSLSFISNIIHFSKINPKHTVRATPGPSWWSRWNRSPWFRRKADTLNRISRSNPPISWRRQNGSRWGQAGWPLNCRVWSSCCSAVADLSSIGRGHLCSLACLSRRGCGSILLSYGLKLEQRYEGDARWCLFRT